MQPLAVSHVPCEGKLQYRYSLEDEMMAGDDGDSAPENVVQPTEPPSTRRQWPHSSLAEPGMIWTMSGAAWTQARGEVCRGVWTVEYTGLGLNGGFC